MPKVSGFVVPKLFPGSKAFAKLLKKKVGEMMKKTKENYVFPFVTLNFVYDAWQTVMGYRRFTDEVAEILKTASQFIKTVTKIYKTVTQFYKTATQF